METPCALRPAYSPYVPLLTNRQRRAARQRPVTRRRLRRRWGRGRIGELMRRLAARRSGDWLSLRPSAAQRAAGAGASAPGPSAPPAVRRASTHRDATSCGAGPRPLTVLCLAPMYIMGGCHWGDAMGGCHGQCHGGMPRGDAMRGCHGGQDKVTTRWRADSAPRRPLCAPCAARSSTVASRGQSRSQAHARAAGNKRPQCAHARAAHGAAAAARTPEMRRAPDGPR